MKKALLLPLFLLFAVVNTSAQYYVNQNKVWVFGRNAGIDFALGSPQPIHTSINQMEGCASVSDPAGNLLFYTNGRQAYNRLGAFMPHGAAIIPCSTFSATQAALVVPAIGSKNRYYLFSMEQADSDTSSHLAYSVVDMNLDGGNGDLVTGMVGIPLANHLSEKMIAIRGDSCNIWLLTHSLDHKTFYAYNITATGIDAPVVSGPGTFTQSGAYYFGVMKASHNRQKIVFQNQQYGTELNDFDPLTGIVSNRQLLDSGEVQYGAEFSPDNSKLYTTDGITIFQYDISLATTAAIKASKTLIASLPATTASFFGDLKLGPDNKIYIARSDSGYLDRINLPDISGSVCGYTIGAVTLLPGTYSMYGLPNTYIAPNFPDIGCLTQTQVIQPGKTLSLYPNPATTELTISAPEKITGLSITNIVGQEVVRRQYNSSQVSVDVHNLPAGMYFIRVNGITPLNFMKE
jgi:hypothetical protein